MPNPFNAGGMPYFDGGPAWIPTEFQTANITTTGNTALDAAAPANGGFWCVDDLIVSTDTASLFTLKTADGTVILKAQLPAGYCGQLTPRAGFRLGTAGQRLQCAFGSAPANAYVFVAYHEAGA